jgi:VWFA-related protein
MRLIRPMLRHRLLCSSIALLALCTALTSLAANAQQPPPPAPADSSAPAAPAPQQPAPSQDQAPNGQAPAVTIPIRVNLVDILFTVLDRRNKLVPNLEKSDFKIFDDKTPQEIRYFAKQNDLPLRIGMLLDTSNSIRDRLKFEQEASTNFLFSVLRHNKDEAFIMTFDDEPQVLQGFTGDTGALRDEIFKTRAGGGTAIYDAIYQACMNELSHPPRPPGDQPDIVRRVMILISDGEDNLSTHTKADAIEMAQRASVVIYTISTSTQWIALSQTDPDKLANRKNHLTEGDQILQSLADETGGRAFYPYHVDDLDQSFQDIGDELRNEYSIAYIPSNYAGDGRYHRIRIEAPEHKGYQVRARRGYFAKADGPNAPVPARNAPGSGSDK